MNIVPHHVTITDEFLDRCRNFFLNFNPLLDIGKSRIKSEDLAALRNEKSHCIRSPINGRWVYSPKKLTLDDLMYHLIQQGDRTVWVTNGNSEYVIWLCIDVDLENGDIDLVVSELSKIMPLYVEPSTLGKGRHCYFKLNRKFVKGTDIWRIADELIQNFRVRFQQCGVKFDVITGVPTIWKYWLGQYSIEKRGKPMRLPYCSWGLDPLRNLPEVTMADLTALVNEVQFPKPIWVGQDQDKGQKGISRQETAPEVQFRKPILRDKGLVNWTIGPNQYTKLLEIACQYDLLKVYETYVPPMRNRNGEVWRKGCARVIGPGVALALEYEAFSRQRICAEIVAGVLPAPTHRRTGWLYYSDEEFQKLVEDYKN